MNLNGVLIGSAEPGRLVEYYSRLFGEPDWHGGDYSGWQIGNGFLTVGPHDQVHGQNPEPGRLLLMIEAPDVRAEFDRLQAAGATVVREPYQPGEQTDSWIATFADPDDNYFQLVSPMSAG